MNINVAKCLKQIKNPIAAAAVVLVTGIVTLGVNKLADTFVSAEYEVSTSPMGCHVGPAPKAGENPPVVEEEITMTLSEEELEKLMRRWRDEESGVE